MLKRLNENAASTNCYIPFEKLKPGRYPIKKFELREHKYGECIAVFIEGGYVILPERMCEGLDTQSAIDDLNSETFQLIFEGKDQRTKRVNFHFEAYTPESE